MPSPISTPSHTSLGPHNNNTNHTFSLIDASPIAAIAMPLHLPTQQPHANNMLGPRSALTGLGEYDDVAGGLLPMLTA
eukprot:2163371-Rhodomonas_salina.1